LEEEAARGKKGSKEGRQERRRQERRKAGKKKAGKQRGNSKDRKKCGNSKEGRAGRKECSDSKATVTIGRGGSERKEGQQGRKAATRRVWCGSRRRKERAKENSPARCRRAFHHLGRT
jgi:hypothetical protein